MNAEQQQNLAHSPDQPQPDQPAFFGEVMRAESEKVLAMNNDPDATQVGEDSGGSESEKAKEKEKDAPVLATKASSMSLPEKRGSRLKQLCWGSS